jgi:hypothetical protein
MDISLEVLQTQRRSGVCAVVNGLVVLLKVCWLGQGERYQDRCGAHNSELSVVTALNCLLAVT